MLCLLFIEADGLQKYRPDSSGFLKSGGKKKLKSISNKCNDQIVINRRNNLHNMPHLDTLKVVFTENCFQFSLLEKVNKNTLYFLKLMYSLLACMSSCFLYTRFFFFHLSGSCFLSVCYWSIPFLKSNAEISFLEARPPRILQYFAVCWTDYCQSNISCKSEWQWKKTLPCFLK